MALPVQFNTISASMINVELGRASTNVFSMNGATERALAGKPTNLSQISFNDFHGKSAAPAVAASLTARTTAAFNFSPSAANAYYRLSTDGNVLAGAGPSIVEAWRDAGSNPDFQVRATYVSGTTPTGTYGSWLALTTTRTWILGRSTVGTSSGVVDFEIRNATTLAVLTTARITFQATVDSGM